MLRAKGKRIENHMKIEFEGIGSFTETLHFIASPGALKKK
jgi:hypothetical protein